jgi:hypothetical protein
MARAGFYMSYPARFEFPLTGSELEILVGEGSGKVILVRKSTEDIKSHRSGGTVKQQCPASE